MFWMFVDNLVLEEEIRDTASRFFRVSSKPQCFQEVNGGGLLFSVYESEM